MYIILFSSSVALLIKVLHSARNGNLIYYTSKLPSCYTGIIYLTVQLAHSCPKQDFAPFSPEPSIIIVYRDHCTPPKHSTLGDSVLCHTCLWQMEQLGSLIMEYT